MKDLSEYERPNTVSGLNAKRKELVKLLGNITAEAEKVRANIKHIDACVALFDPKAKPPSTYHTVLYRATQHPRGI